MSFPSIEEIVLSFILQLHTTLVHMNDNSDEGICGNRILSSTQWELSVERLPDWKRLSVGDVVKVRSATNKVD